VNIAIFPSAYWPHVGGVEELSRQLVHELRSRGHGVLVVTNQWPRTLSAVDDYEGISVRRYAFRVPEHSWRQMGGAILFGPNTLNQMCRDLSDFGADLLHVQCVSSNAYYAMHAKRRLKLPLVVTLQGELNMDAGRLFERSVFARKLMRNVLTTADAITACSRQTLNEAEEFFGKPFGLRAQVIYNGVRLADFSNARPYNHGRPYVFAIGRHVVQKGFDVLLEAFAQTVQRGQLTHDLLLAGDGADHETLKKLANQLNLGARVKFLGSVDRPVVAQLFSGCEFFVLPSRHEPMGIVNLEAMAAGKAVIASNVGGVSELVRDGVTGRLIPGADVAALAGAMQELILEPRMSEQMGRAGREHALRFDWSRITDEYLSVYERNSGAGFASSGSERAAVRL
jgi:glycogen synthase